MAADLLSRAEIKGATIYRDIKIRYQENNAGKIIVYPNSKCTLLLFDDYILMLRSRSLIFEVYSAPLMLCSIPSKHQNMYKGLVPKKPSEVLFKQVLKEEIDIIIKDPLYPNHSTEITLLGLNETQKQALEKMKNWY